jgi:opacity protein-like surface antigen
MRSARPLISRWLGAFSHRSRFAPARALVLGFGGVMVTGSIAVIGAAAQTVDRPRMSIGISAGYSGASLGWDVAAQPVVSHTIQPGTTHFYPTDQFHVNRGITAGLVFAAHATWFPQSHLGVGGEVTYLAQSVADRCEIVVDGGDPLLRDGCTGLNTQSAARNAILATQLTLIFRLLPGASIQPFLRAGGGMASASTSTIEMSVHSAGQAAFQLYTDDRWSQLRPTWTIGAGISTSPSSGFQLLAEVRETSLRQTFVSGSSGAQGENPPHGVGPAFLSLVISADIVLSRVRGRRY